MKFRKITSLEKVLKQSNKKSLFIYIHSLNCAISNFTKKQMEMYLRSEDCFDVYLISIPTENNLSDEIEEALNVEHKTPQLIFVENSKPKFVLNQSEITLKNIEKNLK